MLALFIYLFQKLSYARRFFFIMPVLEKTHNTTRTTNSESIIINGFHVENVAQSKFLN